MAALLMIYPQATAPLAVANPLLGLGPGLGALKNFTVGTDPSTLSSCLWDCEFGTSVFTDTAGTTPASTGTALKYWGNRKAGAPITKFTEAATNACTLTADGVDNNGSGRLEADAVVTVTGTFTAYVLGVWDGNTLHWSGQNGAGSGVFFYSNNVYVCIADFSDAHAAVAGAVGTRLFRVRRTAANACYFAGSGVAETLIGTKAGDLVLSQMFGRKGVDLSSAGNAIRRNCLFNSDLVADGTASAVELNIAAAAL